MKHLAYFLSLLILLIGACPVHAAEGLPAGFAPGPVWVSKNAPTAGEKVHIYAAIYNASDTPIEGSITFSVDSASVGSVPFTLGDGETMLKSVPWTATEGSHTVEAAVGTAIEKQSKQATSVRNSTTGSVTVVVAAEAAKPVAIENISAASGVVSTAIASGSPVVASVTSTIVDTAEAVRKAGEAFLADAAGTAAAATTSERQGQVLGAETYVPEEAATETPSQGGFMQSIAQALLPIFAYPAIFYPLFFIILLVGFWIVARRLRNPRRRRR